jgi:hypothetical protein
MEQKPQASWHILARITNKDGIDTALCLWRFKGASEWNKVLLTDSAGYFTGDIPNLSNNYTDTIEYYLDALSNNGKRMSKPITAPRGYYTFWFTNTSSYISGKVYYDNKANSPIERTTVYLTDDIGNIIKTADCDTSGNYRIEGLQNGIYKIYASTASQPGGFDPLDGLLINKYFIKTYTFQDNLCLGAADVNNDLSVNLQDALLVSRRYINLISSFSAGDWLSEKINITINKNNLHQNIRLICFGDVNASYKF